MYNFAPSNAPEDLDLARLWHTICTNETIFTLGADTITNPLPTMLLNTSLGTPSSIALCNEPIADTLLTVQASLHRVIVSTMGGCTLRSNGSIAGGTERAGYPETHEAMLQYVNKAFAFLSKLGEWEIEFKMIKAETPRVFHIHFAVLEIEYHYLTLIYVTQSLLTVCYGIPLAQASEESKCSIWTWSVTGNKAGHRVLESWSKFSSAMSEPGPNDSSTSGSNISGSTQWWLLSSCSSTKSQHRQRACLWVYVHVYRVVTVCDLKSRSFSPSVLLPTSDVHLPRYAQGTGPSTETALGLY
ncbi:hypothetical protein M422DRAFT_26319 [Sphaerobolus stellatus SS14]|nr:hypothetical protein M422DRAFT_26319 [Sphaerobolus stellatus SS14]